MGNKKFKSLQQVRNGELKQALEEGATDVVPLEAPQGNPSESIQMTVQVMEKITEKAKKLEEYNKLIDDIDKVMKDFVLVRYVYLKASETMDDSTKVFKQTVVNTESFVKTLESICGRICEIICRIEGMVVETKLNDEDADLIRKYQAEVTSKLTEFKTELQNTNEAFCQKETELMKKHQGVMLKMLNDHQRKMQAELKNNNGVWFSFWSFMVWATISIPCIFFTGMYISTYIYMHCILPSYHWFINLFH